MKARLETGSYHVFGSGCAGASLRTSDDCVRIAHIEGSEVYEKDNGFVGYISREYDLPENMTVHYRHYAIPGHNIDIKCSWRELVEQRGMSEIIAARLNDDGEPVVTLQTGDGRWVDYIAKKDKESKRDWAIIQQYLADDAASIEAFQARRDAA